MKRLMIDMDNCITDALFIERINDFLGTNYKLEEQTDFFLQNLTGDRIGEFWHYMADKDFYGDSPLIKDCYEVLEKLNKKYKLYIITAYLYKGSVPDISGANLKAKYYYLKEKLPFIEPEQYIFINDKSLIESDIAIDDRLDNLKSSKKKILMSAWHNMDITDEELRENEVVRVSSWKEIENLLDY